MTLDVICPGCREPLQVPAPLAGQEIQCPHCHSPVTVTAAASFLPLQFAAPAAADPAPLPRNRAGMVRGFLYFFAGLVFVVFAIGGLASRWSRLMIDLKGPQTLTAAELKQVEDPSSLSTPWVIFDAPRVVETNIELEMARPRGGKMETRLILVQVDDRMMVAEVPIGFTGQRVEGMIEKDWVGLHADALKRIKAKFPRYKDEWLPVQMSADRGSTSKWPMIQAAALAGLVVVGIGCLLYGGRRLAGRF